MAEEKKHGGRRPGAGRKKTGRCRDVPHRRRPELSSKHAVHVSIRLLPLISYRTMDYYKLFRRVLESLLGRKGFRICHISIQHRHLHLIIEADDKEALSRGMQSFGIRVARARGGKTIAFRYFASQITTKKYARHALSYVLNNWRRHRLDFEDGQASPWKLDPFSSAISFDGWTERFARPQSHDPLPVSPPQTALLKSGWQEFGRISPYEVPGPLV